MFRLCKNKANRSKNVLLHQIKDERFLFDVHDNKDTYINYYSANGITKRKATCWDNLILSEISNTFTDWNNKAGKIKIVQDRLKKSIQQYIEFNNVPESSKLNIYYNDLLQFESYKELFDNLYLNYTTLFKCNSFKGIIGNGLLIIEKIKDKSVFIPLIVSTINTRHLSYTRTCVLLDQLPCNSIFNVYLSDLLVNSKDVIFKNIRIAFKKEALPKLKECNLEISDMNYFTTVELPKFKKISDRKQYFQELSEDVLHLFGNEQEVVLNYR